MELRLLRRLNSDMRKFLSDDDCALIVNAIHAAEHRTSGEIRIHIDTKCPGDPKLKALKSFHKLGMKNTAARNGVLIYVSPSDRKLAVIGDRGINNVVPAGFWKDVCSVLVDAFASENYVSGLCSAVSIVGEKLNEFFPYTDEDVNELPDDISFEE